MAQLGQNGAQVSSPFVIAVLWTRIRCSFVVGGGSGAEVERERVFVSMLKKIAFWDEGSEVVDMVARLLGL